MPAESDNEVELDARERAGEKKGDAFPDRNDGVDILEMAGLRLASVQRRSGGQVCQRYRLSGSLSEQRDMRRPCLEE